MSHITSLNTFITITLSPRFPNHFSSLTTNRWIRSDKPLKTGQQNNQELTLLISCLLAADKCKHNHHLRGATNWMCHHFDLEVNTDQSTYQPAARATEAGAVLSDA